MHKMKIDFEIPIDIKNDLVYCQRALTNHISIHQKIVSYGSMMNIPESRLVRTLKLLEKDIMDIGDEQKLLFNRLRFFIDYHQITKNINTFEREKLTNQVREELLNYGRINSVEIRPMNVITRPSEEILLTKFFRSASSNEDGYSSGSNSMSNDMKVDSISGSDEEKLEVLVKPEDVHIDQKVYNVPRQIVVKQPTAGQSLLKPIHQRRIEENDSEIVEVKIRVVRPEIGIKPETVVPQVKQEQPTLGLSRLRLAAALCKAKDANKQQPNQTRIQTESPETVPPAPTVPIAVKCNTPLSSSRSSNGSSVDVDPLKDEEIPDELGQEGFLRLFGLYTPAYTQYLMNRRPLRKKRQCTSTERGDFHYGRFELFERQFANKRNKRQFLYSPPATRAKRRIASNGQTKPAPKEPVIIPKRNKGAKSNGSSSSSLSSNGSTNETDKVCLTCYKRNNLIQCQKCCGKYHAACHSVATEIVTRRTFCPFCVRQNGRSKVSVVA